MDNYRVITAQSSLEGWADPLFQGTRKQCLVFMAKRRWRGVDLQDADTGRLSSWSSREVSR